MVDYGHVLARANAPLEKRLHVTEEAVVGLLPFVDEFPRVPFYRDSLAAARENFAETLLAAGDFKRAEDELHQAIRTWLTLISEFPRVPRYYQVLSGCTAKYTALGDLLADAGRDDEAAYVYGRAVAVREELVAHDPGKEANLKFLHAAYIQAAAALVRSDRLEDAETVYRRAADQYEKLAAAFPSVPGYRLKLAWGYTRLASFVAEADRYDEAAEVYRKGVGVLEELVEELPEALGYRLQLEANYRHLGDALRQIGRVQEAETAYQQALQIQSELADSGLAPFMEDMSSAAHADTWCVISNFDGSGVAGRMIFHRPRISGSTDGHLMASVNLATVTDEVPAFDGDKVCKVQWQWLDSAAGRWLRLTTFKRGNPTIDLWMPVRVRLRLDEGSLRVCLGIRETGVDVPLGQDGGTNGTIEWVGVESKIGNAPQGILVTAKPEVWQTITFVPRLLENVWPFTGDGFLHAANNKGVLEHIAFTAVDHAGPFTLYIDAIEQACPAPDPAGDPDIKEDGGHGPDGRD